MLAASEYWWTTGWAPDAGGIGSFLAVEEVREPLATNRMLQFPDRLTLDLTDPLSGDLEDTGRPLRGCRCNRRRCRNGV